ISNCSLTKAFQCSMYVEDTSEYRPDKLRSDARDVGVVVMSGQLVDTPDSKSRLSLCWNPKRMSWRDVSLSSLSSCELIGKLVPSWVETTEECCVLEYTVETVASLSLAASLFRRQSFSNWFSTACTISPSRNCLASSPRY